jgi:hypothetical protein
MFRLNASEVGLIQSVKNILCGLNKEASRRKEKISLEDSYRHFPENLSHNILQKVRG